MKLLLLLLISTFEFFAALGQSHSLIGSWNYFNHDSIYFEITITKKYIYLYEDSSTVNRYKINFSKNKMSFSNEQWILKQDSNHVVTISTNSGNLRLHELNSLGDELINFYDWYNAKYRNGNGVMIYWRHADERKGNLILKTRNGI